MNKRTNTLARRIYPEQHRQLEKQSEGIEYGYDLVQFSDPLVTTLSAGLRVLSDRIDSHDLIVTSRSTGDSYFMQGVVTGIMHAVDNFRLVQE